MASEPEIVTIEIKFNYILTIYHAAPAQSRRKYKREP